MGNKKKNGGSKPHPTKSFEQYVADATLQKFGAYIDQHIQHAMRAVAQYHMQQLSVLTLRLKAIEEALNEKLGVTALDLASKVAVYEDQAEGFDVVPADQGAQAGDRVRVEILHKETSALEFSKPVRLLINNIGAGATLGKELEDSLIGLVAGETREVVYGKDGQMTAIITLNRLSRRPTPPPAPVEETPVEAAAEEAPQAEQAEEVKPEAEATAETPAA